jgi:hypothetical protein
MLKTSHMNPYMKLDSGATQVLSFIVTNKSVQKFSSVGKNMKLVIVEEQYHASLTCTG